MSGKRNKILNVLIIICLAVPCWAEDDNKDLHELFIKDDPIYVDMLIKKGFKLGRKATHLHTAAARNKLNIVKRLLEKGAKVNTKDSIDWTPLHEAAIRGRTEIVKVLIEHGAKVDARGGRKVGSFVSKGAKQKMTPLHLATRKGHLETIKLLVEKGADINAKDYKKITPLHNAVDQGSYDVIEFLLTKGAEVNIQSEFYDNPTPLHEAVRSIDSDYYYKIVQLLLKYGADIHAKNKEGETPLEFVKRLGRRKETREILEQAEASQKTEEKDL